MMHELNYCSANMKSTPPYIFDNSFLQKVFRFSLFQSSFSNYILTLQHSSTSATRTQRMRNRYYRMQIFPAENFLIIICVIIVIISHYYQLNGLATVGCSKQLIVDWYTCIYNQQAKQTTHRFKAQSIERRHNFPMGFSYFRPDPPSTNTFQRIQEATAMFIHIYSLYSLYSMYYVSYFQYFCLTVYIFVDVVYILYIYEYLVVALTWACQFSPITIPIWALYADTVPNRLPPNHHGSPFVPPLFASRAMDLFVWPMVTMLSH